MRFAIALLGQPHRLEERRALERTLERAAAVDTRIRDFRPTKMSMRAIRRLSAWQRRISPAPLTTFAEHAGIDTPHLCAMRCQDSYALPVDFEAPVARTGDAVRIAADIEDGALTDEALSELPIDVRNDVAAIGSAWAQMRRFLPDANRAMGVDLVTRPSLASTQGVLRELTELRDVLDVPDALLGVGPNDKRTRALVASVDGWIAYTWIGLRDLAQKSIDHGLVICVV